MTQQKLAAGASRTQIEIWLRERTADILRTNLNQLATVSAGDKHKAGTNNSPFLPEDSTDCDG